MYPTLSFAIEEWFGIHLALPIQMFGLWVAFAFYLGSNLLKNELQRKEQEGLLPELYRTNEIGGAPKLLSMLLSGIIGFLAGFKGLEFVLHYTELVNDPAALLLSTKGNILGGLVGGAAFAYVSYRDQKKQQLPKVHIEKVVVHPYEFTSNIIVIAAVAGILGAKVFHNLENMDQLLADPIDALFSFSGLTFYGGLLVAGISIWFYVKRLGFEPIHFADTAALILTLTYGIGRFGCHFAGDGDWGIVAEWTTLPSFLPAWFWQYNYAHNVLSEGVPIANCVGRFCYELPAPVYPTALWEALISLLVFAGLWSVRKRFSVAGVIAGIYLIVMGFERFFIEKIRVNTTYSIFNYHITQAEIISVVSILSGVLILGYVYRNKSKFALENLQKQVHSKIQKG